MRAHAVYATQEAPLKQQLTDLLREAPEERTTSRVHAVVVPDSNLLDGGAASARVFAAIRGQGYRHVIMVAPSRSGQFNRLNVCSLDQYRTPLGEVPISNRLRQELCDEDDDIFVGDEGHFHTHGVDAQLPFLQMTLEDFELVPIVMGHEGPDLCRELGHAVGEVMYNQPTLLVACVSINEADDAAMQDLRTRLENRDVSGLMQLVNGNRMNITGGGALLVALIAALHRSAGTITITDFQRPADGKPGYLGALLST
ncbi:MAG: AmmeMemoRadiSam system protein B [Rhodothermales bacterium]|nr:AmmeMemoRadiSam system protein B [Rhodothermales bacterium]MBO6778349.1 AmmeMemoRadiSam system protein B [Rhodothermales bacterium]